MDRFCRKELEQFGGREMCHFRHEKVDLLVKLRLKVAGTSEVSRKYDPEPRMFNPQAVRLESVADRSAIESC
jgi:hypothetical protein